MKKRTIMVAAAVALLVFGMAAYASAASQTIIGTDPEADGTYTAAGHVYVNTSVQPKITLTLSDDVITTTALDPDAAAPQWTYGVTVDTKANVPTTLSAAIQGTSTVNGANQPTFTSSMQTGGAITVPVGVHSYTDNYAITVDYTVPAAPATYQADVLYTLTQ